MNFGFLKRADGYYDLFADACIEAEKIYATSPALCAVGCRKALELSVKWVYAIDNSISMPYRDNADACIEAEKIYATSPALCAVGCRKALELSVKWVYAIDNSISMPYRDNLSSLLHEQSFRECVDERVWRRLIGINKLGNLSVHTERRVAVEDAILSLRSLFDFVDWIDYCYGPEYENRRFDEEKIPKKGVQLTLQQVEDAILSLRSLFDFVDWIDYCYGPEYENRRFDEEKIPKKGVQLTLQQVKAIKAREELISQKDEEIKRLEAQLKAMSAQATAS